MAGENRNREEQWVDELLRARAGAEPRAGLEERVLARIASEPRRRAFVLWPLAAMAALVVIAIALIVLHTERPKQNLAGQTAQPEKPAKPSADTPSLRASGSASSNREPQKHRHRNSGDAACCVSTKTVAGIDHHSTRESLPTLTTFPARQPETAEERMMARLAARRNSFDLAAITHDPAPLDELSVPKLKVEPMEGTPPDERPRD